MGAVPNYLRDPQAIYRESFAAIRRELQLDQMPPEIEPLVIRLVHACGMPEIVADLGWTDDAVGAGRRALAAGAPILVDSRMVAAGIQHARLPAANPVLCLIDDPAVAERAATLATTRSAAAVDLWRDRLADAVVAIGNAPTALFRLLEIVAGGGPRPALVLGFPVGFVGAAESKKLLAEFRPELAHVALRGRRGGSALASAAVNALLAGADA